MSSNVIRVVGARVHNLKNITVEIPRDKLVVVTGLSGSGKSSLAFDTIFAEGQRRYVESLSAYARQFIGQMDKPDVDYIEGLSPAVSIDQKSTSHNPRFNIEHPGVGNICAIVVATDDERDLACLKFETSANLPLAKLAASQPPLLTDVYHYGYGGLWYKGAFATKGVFSSKSRFWQSLPCAWTVTCNVWYGSSGGGVFTPSGELMGITSLMDIDRQEYLPWLVGVVPYLELEKFLEINSKLEMKITGFRNSLSQDLT